MSNSRRPISANYSRSYVSVKQNGRRYRTVPAKTDIAPIQVTSLHLNAKKQEGTTKSSSRYKMPPRPSTCNAISSKKKQYIVPFTAIRTKTSVGVPWSKSRDRQSIPSLSKDVNKLCTSNDSSDNNAGAPISQTTKATTIKLRPEHNDEEQDVIKFSIDPNYPSFPVVCRRRHGIHEQHRSLRTERLNLDNRNLTKCAILRGEENLRLLNYENNKITKIENLHNLQHLIFLDFYNNKLTKIENLQYVPMLRVLMLGRNEILRIDNLHHLKCLDVLDLHCNQITKIENVSHLQQLRVLNLAGNQISVIENVYSLQNLAELNLKRNKIYKISHTASQPQKMDKLQRLLLDNNHIRDFNLIVSMALLAPRVQQLTVNNNPFYEKWSDAGNIQPFTAKILNIFRDLRSLNESDISAERGKSDADFDALLQMPQNSCDLNANESEEKQPSLPNESDPPLQLTSTEPSTESEAQETNVADEDELILQIEQQWMRQHAVDDASLAHTAEETSIDTIDCKLMKLHKFEKDGKLLKLYGNIAGKTDRFYHRNLTELHFYYIEFNSLSKSFHYFCQTLMNLTSLKLNYNNIHCLYQIDALAVLSSIEKLRSIEFGLETGSNPIVVRSPNLYRLYCIFRLANITEIDKTLVEPHEKQLALRQFALLRNEWNNRSILTTRGFCAPLLHQNRNIATDRQSSQGQESHDLHGIFQQFPFRGDTQSSATKQCVSEDRREYDKFANEAKQKIKYALNVYAAKHKVKQYWDNIMTSYIEQVINDLQR